MARQVRKRPLKDELALGATQPGCLERDIARAILEHQSGVKRQDDRLPQYFLAQFDPGGAKFLNVDADRKLGQGKGTGLGAGQGRVRLGHWLAHDDDLVGAEFVDVDIAAQHGKAVPVEGNAAKCQPQALAVGNADFLDRGLRAYRAAQAIHLDQPSGAGQGGFQETGEHPLVVFLGLKRRGQDQQRYEQEPAHQKACPIPI